jgi:hypothetical protein
MLAWVPLELEIAELTAEGKQIMSLKEIEELNNASEVCTLSSKDLKTFLQIQHSLGKIVYFDTPQLKDCLILFLFVGRLLLYPFATFFLLAIVLSIIRFMTPLIFSNCSYLLHVVLFCGLNAYINSLFPISNIFFIFICNITLELNLNEGGCVVTAILSDLKSRLLAFEYLYISYTNVIEI